METFEAFRTNCKATLMMTKCRVIFITLQCVAQFPAGTSFRPKKGKLGYFRWDFNSSSTEAIRRKKTNISAIN